MSTRQVQHTVDLTALVTTDQAVSSELLYFSDDLLDQGNELLRLNRNTNCRLSQSTELLLLNSFSVIRLSHDNELL